MIQKRLLCLLSFVVISSTFVYAQQATSPLERKIIEKALDNFEMYKSCILVSDDETKSYFLDLFKDQSVPVYNDLLGITNKNNITVSDYLNEQMSNMRSPIIQIYNVNRDRIWEEDGVWKIQLSFDKMLSYQNRCGISFNTQEFYGDMFRETMILAYDEPSQSCHIVSITGKINSDRSLPEDYCILDSTNIKDTKVIYKHRDGTREPVRFNSFHQMLLTSGHEKNQFAFADNDVVVKSKYQPDCHLMTFEYKNHQWKIKPHFDLGIGQSLTIGNESFYSSTNAKTTSFGIDAGFVFPSYSKFKIGVFLGAGISTTKLDMTYNKDLYSFSTNQDIDGDSYIRYYKDLSLSQSVDIKEFSIPIYTDLDWHFSPWVSFYLDLGIKLNLNLSHSISSFSGSSSEVYGVYNQYSNLRLDYHWGYNGFTQDLSLTNNNLCQSERVIVKKIAPYLLAGAGFRFNIPRTPIAIDLGLGYQKGFGKLISVSENRSKDQYNGNMIYNEFRNNTSTEEVHDLVESSDGVSRSLLTLNIGLLFKF